MIAAAIALPAGGGLTSAVCAALAAPPRARPPSHRALPERERARVLDHRMRRSRPIEISLAGWFSVRPAGVFAFVSAQNELSGDSRMSSL